MIYRVGQQVVCIKKGQWSPEPYPGEPMPVYGGVYTIARIRGADVRGPMSFVLRECDLYVSYMAHRFRPVKETDISAFTALLAPTPNKLVDA